MNLNSVNKIVPLGRILITEEVEREMGRAEIDVLLGRHAQGDWGELNLDQARQNEVAMQTDDWLLSTYQATHDFKVSVMTKPDRSATIVILARQD